MRPVSDLSPEQYAIVQFFLMHNEACFYKIMGKTSIHKTQIRLEFPSNFMQDHAEKFGPLVRLQRPGSGTKWEIRVQVVETFCRSNQQTQHRALVLGRSAHGWKEFVADNDVQLGDLLIFILVDGNYRGGYSKFMVHIFRNFVDGEETRVTELLVD